MFIGEYQYKVDEKGRLPLPPKFRRELKEGVVLAKGMGEKCIAVYTIREWRRVSDKLAEKALTGANLRRLTRAIHGSAFSASFDGQGRIKLPDTLRVYAGISDTAIVVGANARVELWSQQGWKAEQTVAEEQASQIIETLGA
ncbi:MAG: division/cell wall cluster transcriptional repressor MraZ [Dehalococcoidia bacterium]|jgi:MraZ protein|nr:division/cell wall cluster transcriptional repressor MraZ [Dehalococcoidia bacterium]